MKVFIVYCHPSDESFTRNLRDSFIKGIVDSGNEYVISDLYKMNFKSDMTEQEYLRDANYRDTLDLAADVLSEHEKINSSDAIVFIYLYSGPKDRPSLSVGLTESGLSVLHMVKTEK